MASSLLRTHRLMVAGGFYPLVLASAFACTLLVGRVRLTESYAYWFLIWNLFLAWVPFGFSALVALINERFPGRWWLWVFPASLWLLFFPNAMYLVTDLMHLWNTPPAIWWYDIGTVAAFALTGCMLAVGSLSVMQRVVGSCFGWATSWLFVLMSIGLSGLGVYLGRFVRLNSWDLFFSPRAVVRETIYSVLHPELQLRTIGVTGLYGALLLFCYLMFVSSQRPWQPSEPHQ